MPDTERLWYGMWGHLHGAVKRQPFSPAFPSAESIVEALYCLFLWNFKEKAPAILWHSYGKGAAPFPEPPLKVES
ncbi:hypothetical protein [uncultured Bilophila sp.]|uniref:hypothetical protein n=1 Tax=uncultured Bilophila sp. TaxID=529385 RepID=UPI00266F6A32|nr:hypothetical protein [uncultured Bilophila sp.]